MLMSPGYFPSWISWKSLAKNARLSHISTGPMTKIKTLEKTFGNTPADLTHTTARTPHVYRRYSTFLLTHPTFVRFLLGPCMPHHWCQVVALPNVLNRKWDFGRGEGRHTLRRIQE